MTHFDLAAIESELQTNDAYLRGGHTARTLIREADMRIVLIVLKAGAKMAEHRADETASIHVLSGHLRLCLPDRSIDVVSGQLLVLERGLPHDVEAVIDTTFLLTLGWR